LSDIDLLYSIDQMPQFLITFKENNFLTIAATYEELMEKVSKKLTNYEKKIIPESMIRIQKFHDSFKVLYDIDEDPLPEEGRLEASIKV